MRITRNPKFVIRIILGVCVRVYVALLCILAYFVTKGILWYSVCVCVGGGGEHKRRLGGSWLQAKTEKTATLQKI